MAYFGILALYAILIAIFVSSYASSIQDEARQAGSGSAIFGALNYQAPFATSSSDEQSEDEEDEETLFEATGNSQNGPSGQGQGGTTANSSTKTTSSGTTTTQRPQQQQPVPAPPYARVGGHYVTLEIADTASERSQGLSGRASLGANSGMLFVFDSAGQPGFWMKNMNFALDFIWIRGNTIVGVTQNVPPPTPGQDLEIYYPPTLVDKVLEVNAGWVAAHGGASALINSSATIVL